MRNPSKKLIMAVLFVVGLWLLRARAAVTVYGEEPPSNAEVTVSSPTTETNVPTVQTNRHVKRRSGGDYPRVTIDETGVHVGGAEPMDIQAPGGIRGYGVGAHLTKIVGLLCTFGMPVAIVAVALYFHHRRNKLAHETLRAMIDKGVPITPELVAELRGKNPSGPAAVRPRVRHLLPGLILVGVGAALALTHEIQGGLITLFIGVAFLVVWAVEQKNRPDIQPPKQ